MNDEQLVAWAEALAAEEAKLPESLPYVTRMVMAQDIVSARHAHELVDSGEVEAEKSLWLAGSYARMDYALRLVAEGRLSEDWLFRELPSLWRGSDPDDTDKRFLDLWKRARARAGAVIRDEEETDKPLPTRRFRIYRGQRGDDPLGISWSLSRKVAEGFALGASFRGPIKGGGIIVAHARPSDVLAYLTGRGEYEVVIDPENLR